MLIRRRRLSSREHSLFRTEDTDPINAALPSVPSALVSAYTAKTSVQSRLDEKVESSIRANSFVISAAKLSRENLSHSCLLALDPWCREILHWCVTSVTLERG